MTSTQKRNVLRRQSFHCGGCVAREEFAAKMPSRCVAGGCSNTPDLEKGIGLHSIPYFGDDRPQAKKRRKKLGGLCKAKASEVGAFEELGHLFSALQARRFSTFVRNFAWAKHTLYPPSKQGRLWSRCFSNNSCRGKSDRTTTVRAQQKKGEMI